MLDELEILCLTLVAYGHSATSIAIHADVPRNAIGELLSRACGKLQADNLLQAVAKACRLDLLKTGEAS